MLRSFSSHLPLFAWIALTLHGTVFADIVTLEFDQDTDGLIYLEHGFRIQPEPGDHFEVDFVAPDTFGFHDGSSNIPPNILTLDYADGSFTPFTPISVDIVATEFGFGGIVFTDSFGTSITATSNGPFSLASLASNSTYVKFHTESNENLNVYAIDNFVIDAAVVPEASSFVLGTALTMVVGAVTAFRKLWKPVLPARAK